ncbi:hypothetical protein FCV25MIE_02554 [Fagus crenata]
MSSGSENQSSKAKCVLDWTVKELHKQSKVSYTRDFLISLAELDTCKKFPCGFEFDPSILCEYGDVSNCSSQSRRNSDSELSHDNLSRTLWRNPAHSGILGHGASPGVSGCLNGVSTLGVPDKGLLHRSNEPYRPPRTYKAVCHSGRQSSDSYNDETFGSSECLSQEMAGGERRRKASFELMRKEQQKGIQEKHDKISHEHKENLGMVALLQNSVNDMRLEGKCNESEQRVASAASNNDSVNCSSIKSCAFIPTLPPGFTSTFPEESLGRKSLTHSPVTQHFNDGADQIKSPVLCSSEFAHQIVEEEGKPTGGISSNMKGEMYGVPRGLVTETNCLFPNKNDLLPKLMTCTSQSAEDLISEQLYCCNKPIVTQEVLTCGHFERSFLSGISENASTQHQNVQGFSCNDTKDGQQTSPNQHDASQRLLSMCQKDTVLIDLAESQGRGLLFDVGTDSNVINIFSKGNTGKSNMQEAVYGTNFTKELQLPDASVPLQKGSASRVTKNDALLPCEFPFPEVGNNFFPSKLDEYRPSRVNSEGIMSTKCNKKTDLSEMTGNQLVSDAILAEIGSKVQPKLGLKLNPVIDFDEKSDSTIEISLPDEESLVTFDESCLSPNEDSLITFDDFSFLSDDSVKSDLFGSSSPVHNVTLSEENSLKLNPVIDFDEKSDSTIEISLPDEESLVTFDESWLLPDEDSLITFDDFSFLSDDSVKADLFGSSSPVHNVTLSEENSSQLHLDGPTAHCKSYGLMGLETSNHTLHAQQSYSQFHHTPPFMGRAFYSPNSQRNSMKSKTYPCNPPPCHYFTPNPHIGRDNNRRTFDALLGEELRAKQMQLFTGSGPGPATFGKQV